MHGRPRLLRLALLLLLGSASCTTTRASTRRASTPMTPSKKEPPSSAPVGTSGALAPKGRTPVSQAQLGQRVTLVGWAVNRKNGAELRGEDFSVWIADLGSWPDGFYTGGPRGKKVRVSGLLAEDHGLPVFVPRKDQPVVQGMPMPEGTNLKKASHRFILRDARWELVR